MHNFLRVYDIGNGAPIQTIKVCATTLPKAKNQFRFIFPFAGNAGGVPCKLITRLKYWISHLVNFFFDYVLRLEIYPILPACESYRNLLPSLYIRPFFLKKKDQKFKPALRRMLKHRKNVALHAQFFAHLRYWERRADTNYLRLCKHFT